MEKIFRNNRLIALAFFTVFSVAAIPDASGNDSNHVNHAVPVEMKFMGKINDQPLFMLIFTGNPSQNNFNITIRDEFDEVLYRENILGEHFSKKFLLNTDELGDVTLLFEINCRKTKRKVIYRVNRTTKLMEDVAISELR